MQRVEVPVLSAQDLQALTEAVAHLRSVGEQISAAASTVERALSTTQPAVTRASDTSPAQQPTEPESPEPVPAPPAGEGASDGRLGLAQRQILTVLAQHGQRTTNQVALLTGRSHKGGGYRNALSTLRSSGLIEGRGDIRITDAGRAALGSWEPLPPPGPGLIDWWAQQLDKAPRLILQHLASTPHRDVPIAEIAEATEYSSAGGGFRNAISRLRSLDLATGRGELRINPDLLAAGDSDRRRQR